MSHKLYARSNVVTLFGTKNGDFIFIQNDLRTRFRSTIQESVNDYISKRCVYNLDFVCSMSEPKVILTLEPSEIKDLHLTHPELFL